MAKKKLGLNISFPSLILGLVAGVAVTEIFRTTVDGLWNRIPFVNTLHANNSIERRYYED